MELKGLNWFQEFTMFIASALLSTPLEEEEVDGMEDEGGIELR